MSRERTFIIPPSPPPKGHMCPRCWGRGNMGDGFFSYSMLEDGSTEVTVRDPTKCSICLGSGRVECTALPISEVKRG